MQTILRKRTIRELKTNALRYLALFLLIVLGMYIVISIVGSADNIILAQEEAGKEYKTEDGQFEVFVPLSDAAYASLTSTGITLEKLFSMDYVVREDGTLRVFKNRKEIDLVNLYEGKMAEQENELVLERNYARSNGLHCKDKITIGGEEFTITGIATTADYESPLQNMTDTTVESKKFGTAFVTEEAYTRLKEQKQYVNSEVYTYAYRLNGCMTEKQLKNRLRAIKAEQEDISDIYFKEIIDAVENKKKAFEDGISSLQEGSESLHSGLTELKENNDSLNEGAEEIFHLYLQEVSKSLEDFGADEELTEKNYRQVIEEAEKEAEAISPLAVSQLQRAKEQLDSLKAYKDGIAAYTKAEGQAAKGSKELSKGIQELQKNTKSMLEKQFSIEIDNLSSFVSRADNPRIGAAVDDVRISKQVGIVTGVIMMILFTFVISVFVIHGIEKENTVIGALYALGVNKRQLLVHYLTLPVVITLAGGLIGTILGFSPIGIQVQEQSSVAYYSLPEIPLVLPAYLIVYGIFMPPLAAIVVNYFVINKKLGEAPLTLLRNEKKQGRIRKLNLRDLSYIRMFQIRQFLREMRSGITILFGMLLSLVILFMGMDCYAICINMVRENEEDTRYEYMYSYKYPTASVPKGGEACYMETLKREVLGYNLDITLLGMEKNEYFPFKVAKGQNKVTVSQSAATKLGLKEGDKLVLSDEVNERDYAFTVERIVPYSVGLYVFMDLGSMRELFGQENTYYNVVYAKEALNIEEGRLYATTTKQDIVKSSKVFLNMMYGMIFILDTISILIFVVVMYLMLKVAIDRSSSPIALMKVFGYRDTEVRKLYLDGTFYLVAVGGIIGIIAAKIIVDQLYPFFVANVACGMNLSLPWWNYPVIYVGILLCYLFINRMLVRKVRKIVPAEVLKNRE